MIVESLLVKKKLRSPLKKNGRKTYTPKFSCGFASSMFKTQMSGSKKCLFTITQTTALIMFIRKNCFKTRKRHNTPSSPTWSWF